MFKHNLWEIQTKVQTVEADPFNPENIMSYLEAKQGWAWLVLGWEVLVNNSCCKTNVEVVLMLEKN